MNYRLILVLALAAVLSLPGCSPYDDGPKLSLKGKKARLTGVWKLVDTIGWSSSPREWDLERDGSFTEERSSSFVTGIWEFRDGKSELVILKDSGDRLSFEILRLSNSELRLEDADDYQWFFEKQ